MVLRHQILYDLLFSFRYERAFEINPGANHMASPTKTAAKRSFCQENKILQERMKSAMVGTETKHMNLRKNSSVEWIDHIATFFLEKLS
jgi:hypothetical protein